MAIGKTFKTLISKPWILLLALIIGMLPYVLAGVLAGGAVTYDNSVILFSIILTVLLIGPYGVYTYESCNESVSSDWFIRGLTKKAVMLILIIVISRYVLPIVKSLGMVFGFRIFGGAIFVWDAVALTFEAVAIVAIVSTDDFSDAIDMAVNVTKSIYLKVAAIAAVFMVLGLILFPSYTSASEQEDENMYAEETGMSASYEEMMQEEEEDAAVSETKENNALGIFYGLFDSISNAFVLTFCAHNFIEVKQMRDSAMARLNSM